jgi:acyl transferase domain-containing protein
VNSFGYGGSNAHVIIEEVQGSLTNVDHRKRDWNPLAVSKSASEESPGFPRIYLLSGFDEVSCAQQMQALCTYILEKGTQNINEGFLDNLAFTINERRSVFPWKVAVVCGNAKDLAGSLSPNIKARSAIRKPRLGFVFTGQGAQWAGMGKELLPIFPVFKASVLAIDRHLNDIGSGITVQGLQKQKSSGQYP